jgi:putative membrane protein
VADRAVLDALSGETVQELVGELTARLRDEPVDEALCETISDLGRRLAEPLPRAEDDRNELPDGLVLID